MFFLALHRPLHHPEEDPIVGLKDSENGLWGQTWTPASHRLNDVLRQRAEALGGNCPPSAPKPSLHPPPSKPASCYRC